MFLLKEDSDPMIGELAALGAAISWAASALLYRKALLEAKPLSANIVRLGSTGLFLFVISALLGKLVVLTDLTTDVLILAGASGIIGLGIGDTLYMVSLKSIGVSRAVPLTCTYPLFSLFWAVFLIGETVTINVVLGALAIVSGIWLLSKEAHGNNDLGNKRVLNKGVVLALATAVVWSISITMINMAVKETPDLDHAFAINTLRVVAITMSMMVASPVIDRKLSFTKLGARNVVALFAGGVVALGLGWFLLTYSFTHTLESRAVPISSTTPLFSTLVAVVLLHEKVTVKAAAGSMMIVFGVFLIFLV